MDAIDRVRLRIVPSAQILPHEIADPRREQRIESRLREDGVLRDPLMVGAVRDLEGYVLLDGTNRQRSLRALGLTRALVQVIDYGDEHAVSLRTWCHAVDLPLRDLADGAQTIPGLRLAPLTPLAAADSLRTSGTLGVMLDRSEQFALVRERDAPPQTEQLRRLVDLYEERLVRTDCGPDDVEERAQTLPATEAPCTLIAFPLFTRSQVLTMALRGIQIPAGITRHVIQVGRALRVNVPLTLLGEDLSLEAANEALNAHLHQMQPRLYREPTILYDS